MFGTEHLIWIAICAVFVAGMLFFSKKKDLSLKYAGYIMTAICIVSEVSKIMSNMIPGGKGGMVLAPGALPLHLCSLMLFAVLYITFGKNGTVKQTLINFVAVMGTLGSICAILIPTNGTDFSKILSYQCFVYHGGLLWFSLYLILCKKAHLGLRSFATNAVVLLSLALSMLYANSVLSQYNTNFMYLVRPPMKNLPFLNLDHGWYVYFLHILCTAAILLFLFHLPFILYERKTQNSANTTPPKNP